MISDSERDETTKAQMFKSPVTKKLTLGQKNAERINEAKRRAAMNIMGASIDSSGRKANIAGGSFGRSTTGRFAHSPATSSDNRRR